MRNLIQPKDSVYLPIIYSLSIAVPLLVSLLLFLPSINETFSIGSRLQPIFHAFLNGSTAILLIMGYMNIKRKKVTYHKICMLSAFILSVVFLLSYVIYHASYPPIKYGGESFLKWIYYFILLSHILLATLIVPLVLITIYRSFTGQIDKHRKIAQYTFPVWMYVSVSGVLVYLLMIPYY